MLITERLFIRLPEPDDARLLKQFEEKNKNQLQRGSDQEEIIVSSLEEWNKRLSHWNDDYNRERAIRFLIFPRESKKQLIGLCNYTHIIREPLHTSFLGYHTDYEFASLGLITEALQITITHMFNHFNLHRIMATYQPSSHLTARILRNLGFKVEGYAYDFLFAPTGWQDHIISSLINIDWHERG